MSNFHAGGVKHVDPAERDLRILVGYADGLSDREIAAALGYSEGHIHTIGYRMRKRLGARCRAHAVGIAYRTGILKVDQT